MENNQPTTQPPTETLTTTPVATPYTNSSKGIAITGFVLSIVAFVVSFFWFIAAPFAIAAIVLTIIALSKRKAGKGLSIAGLIIAGFTLVVAVPFWILVSYSAYYNDIQKAANEAAKEQSSSSQL